MIRRLVCTGMFGRKAVYCRYLELLFCKSCRGSQKRPLPWRMVHLSDFTPEKVSRAAAEFLDSVWPHPLLDMETLAPATVRRSKKLTKFLAARAALHAEFVRG